MKVDVNAFFDSLPIMGVGLLGIFIVTIVMIIGIYILKAITPKDDEEEEQEKNEPTDNMDDLGNTKKESAMDLMKEREKKDFFKEEESNYISHDL
jgi:hypothetical protein